MRRLGWFLVALILASSSLLNVPAASAGDVTFSGALVPGGPTVSAVATITTPICTGGSTAFAALYAATTFTVDVDGVYAFYEPGATSAMYLYAGSFSASNTVANCVAASNSNPLSFTYPLTAGATYIVVVIDDTFTQAGLSYSVTISGPGKICVGGSCKDPGGCDLATGIPAGAVSGEFVDYATVYSTPGNPIYPPLTIAPGRTYLVVGQDASGQYRKILLSCSWVWVESDTVIPDGQSPWNGMPFPTTIVN